MTQNIWSAILPPSRAFAQELNKPFLQHLPDRPTILPEADALGIGELERFCAEYPAGDIFSSSYGVLLDRKGVVRIADTHDAQTRMQIEQINALVSTFINLDNAEQMINQCGFALCQHLTLMAWNRLKPYDTDLRMASMAALDHTGQPMPETMHAFLEYILPGTSEPSVLDFWMRATGSRDEYIDMAKAFLLPPKKYPQFSRWKIA